MRARALARWRSSAITVGVVVLGCWALAPLAAPTPALASECPNEQVRGESNTNPATGKPYSATLPDCRAYEMVSPLYKEGQNARPLVAAEGPEAIPVAPDGNAVGFFSIGTFSNPENYLVQKNGPFNPYIAVRGASGWRTIESAPPAALLFHPFEEALAADFSPDLRSKELSCGNTQNRAAAACAVGALGTSWAFGTPLYPYAEGKTEQVNHSYLGASRDFTRAFIEPVGTPAVPLRAGDITPIYEIAGVGGESPRLRKVNVDNAGNELRFGGTGEPPLLGASGTEHNGTNFHAISEDGKTVYFTAVPHAGEPIPTVYARMRCEAASSTCKEDNEGLSAGEMSHEFFETVAISNPSPSECQPECEHPEHKPAFFQGASADGKIVFFTTEQELLPQDTDLTNDLYAYDFSKPPSERLVQISALPGGGAEVLGVVRSSADGSHVYFLAAGVLTSAPNANGETALNGGGCGSLSTLGPCLYGYDTVTKEIKFVSHGGQLLLGLPTGEFCCSDTERHAQTTPDGRYLVFSTPGELQNTGHTGPGAAVYRYDFSTGELVWVSHGAPKYKEQCEAELETQAKGEWSSSLEYAAEQAVEKSGKYYEALKVSQNLQPPEPATWKEITLAEYEVKEHLAPKGPREKERCEKEGKDALVSPLLGANGGAKSSGTPGGSEVDSEDWNRAISENGEYIIFTTEERLQGDHEGTAPHVYSWRYDGHNGTVGKISPPGEGTSSCTLGKVPEAECHLPASGMSATGSDIFFLSRAQLVGQDTDGLVDVYDARSGGGFPAPSPEPSCSGEACQGSPSPPPSFGPAASSLSAPGSNLPPGTIVGGGPPPPPKKPASKPLTRAQQLAKALKACKGKSRKKRAACEAQARRRYGSKGKAKSRKRGGK
jgi:hypothetical protein